ncbi:Protein CBG27743 [Caenorhabditis briggsae]|uniref:Protein CBG27743 n=1 Tax=Caenorhabditis briggsae TaxID=6238 RepID=B6IJ41_CAEBR|nr:Protein CBG27743 [Caenorhabditis briggsae]CAS00021.1 Protein CBG27743 [Caenorhabditis briggsae]
MTMNLLMMSKKHNRMLDK